MARPKSEPGEQGFPEARFEVLRPPGVPVRLGGARKARSRDPTGRARGPGPERPPPRAGWTRSGRAGSSPRVEAGFEAQVVPAGRSTPLPSGTRTPCSRARA